MTFTASGITFDFSQAHNAVNYEEMFRNIPSAPPTARNEFWPGVDFCIEHSSNETLWLEVKNWDAAKIAPRQRGGNRRSFFCKMKSTELPKKCGASF